MRLSILLVTISAFPLASCSGVPSSGCVQYSATTGPDGKPTATGTIIACPSPAPSMTGSIVPVGTPSPNPSPIGTPSPPSTAPTSPPLTVEPTVTPNPSVPTATPISTPVPIQSVTPTDSPTGASPVPRGSPRIITGPGLGRADDIADTIGYNSETLYRDTPYHLVPAVMQHLKALGVRHFRDSLLPHGNAATRNATDANTWNPPNDPSYIEPCLNEYDTYHDPKWVSVVASCIINQTTILSHRFNVPILAPSFAHIESFSQIVEALHKAHYDFAKKGGYAANVHFGACEANPNTTRYKTWTTALNAAHLLSPRVWVTETGYGTWDPSAPPSILGPNNYGNGCALPDDIIAAYEPQLIMYLRNLGVERVYLFEGSDVPKDHVFGGMGAVRPDGSYKPQAIAIGNLIRLYSDSSGKCEPHGAAATVTADTPVISRTDEYCSHKKIVYVQPDTQAYTDKPYTYRGVSYGDHARIPLRLSHASISLSGYHATLLYTGQPDGSMVQSSAPSTLTLDSIYPRWVIESPN